jgi:hypothetical protein
MKQANKFAKACFWAAGVILAVVAVLLLTGCRSVKYVEVEKVRTDTTYITKQQRDSIWLHDSLYIHEYTRGDTVYLERTKWLTKYVERTKTDTLWRSLTDTVIVEKVVEKTNEVRSWWQRLRMNIGTIAIILLILAAFFVWVWRTK